MNDIASPALLTLEQDIPLTRTCSKCEQELPLTAEYFYRNEASKRGFMTACKQCRKQYREARKDEKKQRNKQYQEAHKDEIKQWHKQYYETHKDEIQQRNNRYHETHKDEIQRRQKRHLGTERGRFLYRAYQSKRRASQRSVPGTLTHGQILHKLKAQKYRCYYASCGHAKFEKKNGKYVYHLEHTIPLSRAEHNPRHDASYVVLACPHCNLRKKDKLPHEFFEGGRLF